MDQKALKGDRDGRMGPADAYMMFVGLPLGLATIGYCVHRMVQNPYIAQISRTEMWGMVGMMAVMALGMVLMHRDPGMKRNRKAARLRAARRAARRRRITVIAVID